MTINYSMVLPFEDGFDPNPSTKWMQRNWIHSVTLSLAYAAAIYLGQRAMEKKPVYCLKNTLFAWNLCLALFSIVGCVRMTPEFVYVLRNFGFTYSMCNSSFARGVTGFWTEMFAISKVLEFGDTAFLILRKRPLSFLHWYHHSTVLIYTWHAYKDHTAAGRWFVWMNYTVHSLMYTYFAVRSLEWKLPKCVAMGVTGLQLTQMIVGCYIAIAAYQIKNRGDFCQQTYANLYFNFFIYITYFALFANFFYGAYVRRGNKYVKKIKKDDDLPNGVDQQCPLSETERKRQ